MGKRIDFWKKQGYTDEQIENHLKWERRKNKEVRDRKKENNKGNKEIIKQIKNDLLGKEFEFNRLKVEILSIRESVDGVGFWYKMNKTFSDGSSGEFREFSYFGEYNLKDFLKYLSL